jgi:flavorubredoxin
MERLDTTVAEIADGIYRLSTYVPNAGPGGFTFNQFLIVADEPLLFHTGGHMLFPSVSQAISSILPLQSLRWISFGHYEADECGAMNDFLQAAPNATVANGMLGVMLSINDQALRAPKVLKNGDVLDLGGKRVRYINTPHVPHGWDAGLIYEETTGTLFAGDLFTIGGTYAAQTDSDILEQALALEDQMHFTALTPNTAPTIRMLADLRPKTLALMHNAAYSGDCSGALRELAGAYEERLQS